MASWTGRLGFWTAAAAGGLAGAVLVAAPATMDAPDAVEMKDAAPAATAGAPIKPGDGTDATRIFAPPDPGVANAMLKGLVPVTPGGGPPPVNVDALTQLLEGVEADRKAGILSPEPPEDDLLDFEPMIFDGTYLKTSTELKSEKAGK